MALKKIVEYWEIISAVVLITAIFSALSTRVSAIEVRQNEDRESQKKSSDMIIDIKADVSYIRGRLEPK